MTPQSAELIAAPAALMLLLAMIWYRRHRATRIATVDAAAEEGVDDRAKRFMSVGRRGRNEQAVDDDAQTTGVIPVAAVEAAATGAPAPTAAPARAVPDDAIFGPTATAADEPDWDSMRLPHTPEPQQLAHQTAPEIAAPPPPRTPPAHEDELITRPGWPLPGDLEAWESADLAPAPAAPEPGFGQWAEVAAARTEEPVGTEGNGHRAPAAGAETIVLGAPYAAPAVSPPTSFTGAMEPAAGSLSEPPFRSFGDGVDDLGEPARPNSPSTDPSFWEVGPASEPASTPEHAAAADSEGPETWPPQAPASGPSAWGTAAPESAPPAPASEPAGEPHGQVGPEDWWASEAADAVPGPTAVPDARSMSQAEHAGMQRPSVTAAPQEADWWDTTPAAPAIPAGEDWWTTPPDATPSAAVASPVEPTAPQPAPIAPAPVGATAVATGAAGVPGGTPGARVLPRLDASAQNRQTAGRFAVGGSAVAPGDGAFTRVRFRAPLDRPILGWAIGDGPHHAPGTLVLVVEAVLNCSTAGLSVLQEDGDAARPDGFTLSLSSDGPGPFAVSGSYFVVTG